MRMPLRHYCDHCGYGLEDPNEEVRIVVLEILNMTFFFCCENCMDKFINERMDYATLYSNGSVDRD